jgi:hypothetical protein
VSNPHSLFVDMVSSVAGTATRKGTHHVHCCHIARRRGRAPPIPVDPHFAAGLVLSRSRSRHSHDRRCGCLRAAGVPLAVHGKIPLAGFVQITIIAAVIGGALVALLNRRVWAPRRRFVQMTIGLTAISCVAPVTFADTIASKIGLVSLPRRSLFPCSDDTPTDRKPNHYQKEPSRCRNT